MSKSAQKQVRASAKKQLRNKSGRSLVKTNITKAEKLTLGGQIESAETTVAVAISSLDKAAEKGIIHRNNASRRKSRLMKKLNQARAASTK
ncbi:MAG: 30S ribosomal protein S20 [Chloroflexi bacterium]|nr:30S ribosomal protein S20 [Chloroflexota bacterium]